VEETGATVFFFPPLQLVQDPVAGVDTASARDIRSPYLHLDRVHGFGVRLRG
jgi:hypothetical protein